MLGLSRKQLSSYLYLAFCRAYNAMKMSSASGVSHEIVYIAFSPFTKIQNSASHSCMLSRTALTGQSRHAVSKSFKVTVPSSETEAWSH